MHSEQIKTGPWYRPRPQKAAPGATAFQPATVYYPVLIRNQRAKKLRQKIGYEADTPTCSNCQHFKPERSVLINSLPQHFPNHCSQHMIRVDREALCNTWQGKDGSTLEP